jgi:hypothetical protein
MGILLAKRHPNTQNPCIEETEHRTSNVQRRTSNNEVAPLRNLISFGRSMFDVHLMSVQCSSCYSPPIQFLSGPG